MKNLRTTLFAAVGVLSMAGTAGANAFNINEHDARETGRAGAAAASDDDASAVMFNPAGIARIHGTSVVVAGSLYIAQGSYENADTPKTKTDSDPQPVPSLYIASRVHDMVAVGVGVYFPFGLNVSWPDNHAQATIAQDSNLKTMFISPVVGLNLHNQVPGLTIAAGPDIVPASVELKRSVVFGDTAGNVDLAADTVGVGFRVGVQYHPPAVPGLKLGVMYRHQVKLNFKGQADFDIADPYRSQLPPDGDAETTIRLPASIWGGAGYAFGNLEVELNAVWQRWSNTFSDDPNTGGTSLTLELPGGQISRIPEDYKNTLTWRLGFDYRLPKQKLNLRAGFIYDPTPIPTKTVTAQLPDVNRYAFTVGASYDITESVGAHFGALWIPPIERDSSSDPADPIFHGTYGVQALVLSLGVTGRFGGGSTVEPATNASVASNTGNHP